MDLRMSVSSFKREVEREDEEPQFEIKNFRQRHGSEAVDKMHSGSTMIRNSSMSSSTTPIMRKASTVTPVQEKNISAMQSEMRFDHRLKE